jgi:hypothetical protein
MSYTKIGPLADALFPTAATIEVKKNDEAERERDAESGLSTGRTYPQSEAADRCSR